MGGPEAKFGLFTLSYTITELGKVSMAAPIITQTTGLLGARPISRRPQRAVVGRSSLKVRAGPYDEELISTAVSARTGLQAGLSSRSAYSALQPASCSSYLVGGCVEIGQDCHQGPWHPGYG